MALNTSINAPPRPSATARETRKSRMPKLRSAWPCVRLRRNPFSGDSTKIGGTTCWNLTRCTAWATTPYTLKKGPVKVLPPELEITTGAPMRNATRALSGLPYVRGIETFVHGYARVSSA